MPAPDQLTPVAQEDPLESFATFKRAWQDLEFTYIHFGPWLKTKTATSKRKRQKSLPSLSRSDYTQLLFAFALERVYAPNWDKVCNGNLTTVDTASVCNVYLLYTLHQTQVFKPVQMVRVDPCTFSVLNAVQKQMVFQGHADVVGRLASQSCFCFALAPGPVGLPFDVTGPAISRIRYLCRQREQLSSQPLGQKIESVVARLSHALETSSYNFDEISRAYLVERQRIIGYLNAQPPTEASRISYSSMHDAFKTSRLDLGSLQRRRMKMARQFGARVGQIQAQVAAAGEVPMGSEEQ